MNGYMALFRARFRTLLRYRAAAIAGIGTQIFWGWLKVMILEAFYHNGTAMSAQPMSLREAITYTWLGQAMLMMLPFTANPDPDVKQMIRTGGVAYELARPMDLYGVWYARALANRSAPTLVRSIPQFALAIAFFGMQPPPSFTAFGAWALATFGALLLVSALMALVTISMLWTISGDGIARLMPSIAMFASGLIIPLPLFPEWSRPIFAALPFADMADAPFRLYMGHMPAEGVGGILLHQAIWTVALIWAGRALLRRGLRRLVVQGG